MGTNYYMSTKDKTKLEKWFTVGEYNLTDKPDWGYEIHVCKLSGGWKPLFQSYSGVHSYTIYKNIYAEGGWILYDEYGEKIKWDDFANLVSSWTKRNERSHMTSISYSYCRCFCDHNGFEFISGDFC